MFTRLSVKCKSLFYCSNLFIKFEVLRPIPKSQFSNISLNMAQKSITSFFTATPKKPLIVKEESKDIEESSKDNKSPITNGKDKRSSKRQRLSSSGSDSAVKDVPVVQTSDKKKKVKRQRIESSGSEEESVSSPVVKEEKAKSESPKTKKSPKLNITPTNKKTAAKKSPLSKKNTTNNKSPSPKSQIKIKEEIESPPPVKSEGKVNVEKTKPVTEIKANKKQDDSGKENVEVTKVAENDYNPAKPKYHPKNDACWSEGEPVPYLALAKTLEAIEGTSARLKIIDILSNYYRSVIALTPDDLLPSIYMCLNQLAPAYHSLELGIAETYLMKAVAQCTGLTLAQLKASRDGDLGTAAQKARARQRTMFAQPPLMIRKVFAALKEIAHMSGQASVNKKIAKIQSLFTACRGCEAKFLIRSLEGKLRIGLAEQSVLQALAQTVTTTPPGAGIMDASKGLTPEQFKAKVDEQALIIKTTYCECPNYEALVPALLAHGVGALPRLCRLTPGVPLKPMLAKPTRGLHDVFARFDQEQFTCEWKYDGERAQIHVPRASDVTPPAPHYRGAGVFSRSQEDNTTKYPEVISRLPSLLLPNTYSCVLDCEAVAYDRETNKILPFQVLSTRKRKGAQESEISVQVLVFIFDLLYLNGESLVRRPLAERRRLLREHFAEVPGEWQFAQGEDCSSAEQVQAALEAAVAGSCEGLMVKALEGPSSYYDIARRSTNWLKLKKDYLEGVGDTVDAVVIGAYLGRGRRAATFGGFLLACRDPAADSYHSLCKIGTGFTDEHLVMFTEELNKHVIDGPRNYYNFDRSHAADVWVSPALVWEVRCADLSLSPHHRAGIGLVHANKGISLRFPRFVRVRDDKTPEQATTAQQIAEMYLGQDQIKNQPAKLQDFDDFY